MMSRCFCNLTALVLAFSPLAFATDKLQKQREAIALVENASTHANIRSAGAPSFRLRLAIKVERITQKPSDGTFEEVWMSPDKWRRQITFPGFDQVEVG